jgi:TamB, inner membrane protein subunit of TAM complex
MRIYRRFLMISLSLLGGLILLLQVPPVNGWMLQGIVTLFMPKGLSVKIHTLRGIFPFESRLGKIKVKDQKSTCLELHKVAVTWRGLDLLRGDIHFTTLSTEKIVLWRPPELPPPAKASSTPFHFPNLAIDQIDLGKLECPPLFSGNFHLTGQLSASPNDSHRLQLNLRFSENPEAVDTLIYDQTGIHYTLRSHINRPLRDFSRLSPEAFQQIHSGKVILDVDMTGKTDFKLATGHVQGEFVDFQVDNPTLQDLLGPHPQIKLQINLRADADKTDADKTGPSQQAQGNITLGASREFSFRITPVEKTDFKVYMVSSTLKIKKEQGHLTGKILIQDQGVKCQDLRLTGLGCDLRGEVDYTDALSCRLSGKIHDLLPLTKLGDYPLQGQVEGTVAYAPQTLVLNLLGQAIRIGSDQGIDHLSLTSKIREGEGPVALEIHRADITAHLKAHVQEKGERLDVQHLSCGTKAPGSKALSLLSLPKPFSIFYKDQIFAIPTAKIKILDGRLEVKNFEIGKTPKGELSLDNITATLLDPLVKNVRWQGSLMGKIIFSGDKKEYYSGTLKVVKFGRRNEFKKIQKLMNLVTNFSHTGQALTIETAYTDSIASTIKGKVQIHTSHYWPQESDPMSTSLKGTLDLAILNAVIWGGDRFKGKLSIEQSSQGTVATPQSHATLTLVDGYYENASLGTILQEIKGTGRYANQKWILSDVKGKDYDKGTFDLTGQVQLQELGMPGLDLHLSVNKLIVVNTDEAIVSLSGKLDGVTLPSHGPQIKGAISVNSALINLGHGSHEPTTIRTFRTEEELTQKEQKIHTDSATTVDIKVDIPKKLLVQGYGLRSEWKGQLAATGPLNSPKIDGRIQSISGHLDIASKRLALAPSTVSFKTAQGELTPILDIRTLKHVREYDTFITITGPADSPKIEFSSLPALSTEGVIALILFDKPLSEVSAAQSLQLATTMATVEAGNFTGGAFDSLNQLLGVDDISLQKAEAAEAVDDGKDSYSLSVGKQLTEKIYVGVEQGVQEDTGTKVKMKVDVTKNTKVDVETGTQNTAVGYGWEFRY